MKTYNVNSIVSEAVKKLNDLIDEKISFVYNYDEQSDWVNIIHSLNDRIDSDNSFSYEVGNILKNDLIDKGIKNFSFYEDEEQLHNHVITVLKTKSYWKTSNFHTMDNIYLNVDKKKQQKTKAKFIIKVA